MATRALLLGYYGARNLGDDMMLRHLLPWLREQGIYVTVISEDPALTEEQFGIPAVANTPLLGQWSWFDSWFRGRTTRLLRAMHEHDWLVVGGGDLIRDDAGWRIFSYTMEKIALAILWRKPVYLVNVGLGHPRTTYGRLVLRWALRHCRRIIVRDRRSAQLCREFGCDGLVAWAPDIALQRLTDVAPAAVTSEAPPGKAYAIVSLRANPDVHGRFPFGPGQLKALAAGLDYLVEHHGLHIRFVPFQSLPEFDDNDMHHQVRAHMVHADHATIRTWRKNPADVVNEIRDAKLMVAMPLHAAILAVAHDVPSVILPYDIKVHEFVAYCGVKEVLSSADLAEVATVRDSLARALAQPATTLASDTTAIWKNLSLHDRRKIRLLADTQCCDTQ